MVAGLSSSLPPSPADSGVSVSESVELSEDGRDRRRFISGGWKFFVPTAVISRDLILFEC